MKNMVLSLIMMSTGLSMPATSFATSPYLSIINMYEQGEALAEFESDISAYTGRCYNYTRPKHAEGSLLVFKEVIISDNGPGFPISKEKKMTSLYEIDPTYFDDHIGIDRSLQEKIDQELRYYEEITFYPSEWQATSETYNDITKVRKNGTNLIAVHTYDDTAKLSEEEHRRLKRDSYKRIYMACYYFKSITPEN